MLLPPPGFNLQQGVRYSHGSRSNRSNDLPGTNIHLHRHDSWLIQTVVDTAYLLA
jgi:hypothetical protein